MLTTAHDYDVVVIGAGPSGCAAASVLADAGARVALVDRATFPREKICGDGLLPDARRALAELGVAGAVEAASVEATTLTMRTGSGVEVRFALPSLVLPRRTFDEMLVDHARGAGVHLLEAYSFAGLEGDGRSFTSARFSSGAGERRLRAGAFLLATGAARKPRESAGLGAVGSGAAALRGYTRVRGLPPGELLIALVRELPRGYAWAFPAVDGLWNVGCGVFAGVRQAPSLARLLERFRVDIGGEPWEIAPKGAPLVTSFPGLEFVRGNLAAVGEAAGLTRPFSGEGIGPALASGMLAARCLARQTGAGGVAAYRDGVERLFRADFRAWRFGEALLRMPNLVDVIVRRASRFPGALRKCAGVLGGTLPAGRVLSPVGLLRLIVGR
jgi:geranylgeranyl reductase family protein